MNSRARKAYDAISHLTEKFPAAFVRFGDRKPLKVGIRDDLLARGIEPAALAAGLRSYCHSVGYLNAMKEGAPRIDLDGNAVGEVTADDAEAARLGLAAMTERDKAKTAAAEKQAKEQPKPVEARAELRQPRPAVAVTVERHRGRKVTTYNFTTSRPPPPGRG